MHESTTTPSINSATTRVAHSVCYIHTPASQDTFESIRNGLTVTMSQSYLDIEPMQFERINRLTLLNIPM